MNQLSEEGRAELIKLAQEVDRLEALCNERDAMHMQLCYAEDALGSAMVRHRKALLQHLLPPPPIDLTQADLLNAIREAWLNVPLSALGLAVPEGTDLYLKIVAHAAKLSYEVIVQRWSAHDSSVVDARSKVKNLIFQMLVTSPVSILQVHDEAVVSEAPVESGNVAETQTHEDRSR